MAGGPGEWIPLMYFAKSSDINQSFIKLPFEQTINRDSASGDFTLRGYSVPYVIQNGNYYNVSLCGNSIFQHPLQFRWLHTSYQEKRFTGDVVMLDNVTINVWNCTHSVVLLEDNFDNQSSVK